MKLWKMNKRSSTLADMSMNRILLSELIAKGALVGIIAGFFGATYRYLILESDWDGPLVGSLLWSYSPLLLIDC